MNQSLLIPLTSSKRNILNKSESAMAGSAPTVRKPVMRYDTAWCHSDVWYWPGRFDLAPTPPSGHHHNIARNECFLLDNKASFAALMRKSPLHPISLVADGDDNNLLRTLELPAFCKPPLGQSGEGIFIVASQEQLSMLPRGWLLQEMVKSPALGGLGQKQDYRVLILLARDMVAVSKLALIRSSALPYQQDSTDRLVQLTNTSIHGTAHARCDEMPLWACERILDASEILVQSLTERRLLPSGRYVIFGGDVLLTTAKDIRILEANPWWDRTVDTTAEKRFKEESLLGLLRARARDSGNASNACLARRLTQFT
jgi:hypothetical protein